MIKLCNLSKSYNGKTVLKNVSLEVMRGESLAIVGGSGSGKTTTLKTINRLIDPSLGKVLIDGKDTRKFSPHILRRKIGYVFQKVGLFPHMNIAENIAVPMKLAGWNKKKIRTRTDELLRLVSLDVVVKSRRPRELSGGQQQRVGVARCLAVRPELMLLDEPFGALDPIVREQLQKTFLELKKNLGLTTILVTHDISEAMIIADRIAVMKDGRLLQVGEPQELLNNPKNHYVQQIMDTPRRQTKALDDLLGDNA
ncbi:MAG: ABC transporter ATP-binding protein [Myxococcales bacterium]|nr:ABC transporter ATP-binding protein [Myxococcales bacterium]USN49789.1 MAG: ABC transporter ATP-binding protein [Myxococcales bacterium]